MVLAATPFVKTESAAIRLSKNPDAVDNPVLAVFLAYWHSKTREGDVPLYSSFVPKEVREHLTWVVIAEALPNFADFRYRLIGSRVAEYFLHNATGKTTAEAFAAWDQAQRDGILGLFTRCCKNRIPYRLTGPTLVLVDRQVVLPDYDALYLPYSTDGISADRVVNIFTFNYQEFLKTRSQRAFQLSR